MQVFDIFLRCVISDSDWMSNFENQYCCSYGFFSVISTSDVAFLYYVLDLNLAGWTEEFEGGKLWKNKSDGPLKTDKARRFKHWFDQVDQMRTSHGTKIQEEYLTRRKKMYNEKLEKLQAADAAKTKPKKAVTNEFPPIEVNYMTDQQLSTMPSSVNVPVQELPAHDNFTQL